MANITLKGNAINTIGTLPKIGSKATDFKLTAVDLSVKSLKEYAGKKIILNIFFQFLPQLYILGLQNFLV